MSVDLVSARFSQADTQPRWHYQVSQQLICILYAKKIFAHTAKDGKWAHFMWIAEKSQEAGEKRPFQRGEDFHADVDFL